MKLSKLFTKTRKELPASEVSKNAQLLIRAGFIHKEMAGVYSYLPLSKRVLDNIARVVKEEMNNIGGQEILLTALQTKELWEQSGRWDDEVVDIWLKTQLKAGGELGLGWSHEEPLTAMIKNFITSYQDLPQLVYQVQTKFRNELRAKSGLMRGREFLMKDMYSFASTEKEHQRLFNEVKKAYGVIFKRLGLSDIAFLTAASGGIFSTDYSYEFQVLAESGEDTIYLDREKRMAINDEIYSEKVTSRLGLNHDKLEKVRASEAANIFNLGTKFSKDFDLSYLTEKNESELVMMGCYGLGISRVMGIIAEVLSDEKGLVWSEEIAPAQVHLLSVSDKKNVLDACEELYKTLTDLRIEVLYDDRNIHPGEKFKDADLIGIPKRVVISEKTLAQDKVEIKDRVGGLEELIKTKELIRNLTSKK